MGISQQFSIGWKTYAEAHSFIKQHGLYKFFVLPILLNVLLFTAIILVGIEWADSFAEGMYNWIGLSGADWGWFNWLMDVIYWSFSIVFNLFLFIIYLGTFRYVLLILSAPIMAYVSEKTEEIATGKSYPFSFVQLLKDTWRGVKIALRNGITEIVLTVVLFLLGFVPIVGWVSPFILFVVQSYFYGFSMMDYYFERQRLTASQSRKLIFSYKWMAIGNGAFFNGALYIFTLLTAALPLVLALLAKYLFIVPVLFLSILPIYSVVAGTLASMKINPNPTQDAISIR